MITNEPKRAIRSLAWAYDSSTIFYMQDNDGDENFHLFAVDNATDSLSSGNKNGEFIPQARDLTPGKNVKAQNIFSNYRYPDEILIGTNQRNPKVREKGGGKRRQMSLCVGGSWVFSWWPFCPTFLKRLFLCCVYHLLGIRHVSLLL